MATNYTVVLFSRQHLGNEAGVFNDVEPNVVFVGRAKDFPFDCPGINTAEAAVLMFQSRDVNHQRSILRVNGVDVFGGLPASPARDEWNGNILLVERHHQLKETGNVLRVEARRADGGSTGDVDDFMLDNVVIMYKNARRCPSAPDGDRRSRLVPRVGAHTVDHERAGLRVGSERRRSAQRIRATHARPARIVASRVSEPARRRLGSGARSGANH